MDCPYCAEEIKDAAIVCKHCSPDLFVIRPLMERLGETSRRLRALEAGRGGDPPPAAALPQSPSARLVSVTPVNAMALSFIVSGGRRRPLARRSIAVGDDGAA